MKSRILQDQTIDGLQYRVNQVVDLPAPMAKAMSKDGLIDTAPAAVDYCMVALGAKVLAHDTEQTIAAKQALLAAESHRDQLSAALDAETDAEKRAALQKDLQQAEAAVSDARKGADA